MDIGPLAVSTCQMNEIPSAVPASGYCKFMGALKWFFTFQGMRWRYRVLVSKLKRLIIDVCYFIISKSKDTAHFSDSFDIELEYVRVHGITCSAARIIRRMLDALEVETDTVFNLSDVLEVVKDIRYGKLLSPLTGRHDEFIEVRYDLYQNRRCSSVFRHITNNGTIDYDVNGYTFQTPSGVSYNGLGCFKDVIYPYMPEGTTILVDHNGVPLPDQNYVQSQVSAHFLNIDCRTEQPTGEHDGQNI
jgi:hypothetical protein